MSHTVNEDQQKINETSKKNTLRSATAMSILWPDGTIRE